MNETKLELRQPFTSTLSQLSLHKLSQQPQKGQFSSQQVGYNNLVYCPFKNSLTIIMDPGLIYIALFSLKYP